METLPKDIIIKIAMELSPPDLIKLCLVNKNLKEKLCDNRNFWVEKLKKDYPHALYTSQVLKLPLANPKNTYIRNFTEIQTIIDKTMIGESENLKKNLYMDIAEFISYTPYGENVDYEELAKYLEGYPKIEKVIYELQLSEARKRDQLKELRKINL